jgi:hypothetical protein
VDAAGQLDAVPVVAAADAGTIRKANSGTLYLILLIDDSAVGK